MKADITTNRRQTISACMVIYNEEDVIERCLMSLQGAVDEIVIVHDGECTDKTLEICRKYTGKIYIRPHTGIGEVHRVFTFNQAMGDWILYIDADEVLSPELKHKLPSLVQDESIDGYDFIWPLWDGHKVRSSKGPWRPVLYRKSKLYYIAHPQEAFRSYGQVKKVPLTVMHRPKYNNYTYKRFKSKWLPWAKIHAEWILKDIDDIDKFNYSLNDWPKTYKFARDHAYFFPLYGVYASCCSIKNGSWKDGLFALKTNFMWGAYISCVYYYVLKYQLASHK